jgi:sugar phosphate isomerase/epimerase
MVFGYSTNAFVKFSLLESLERIAGLGFKGVEIMGDRPHLYPPDFGADKIEELKAALAKHQLKVTNINSFTLFAVGDTYLPSFIEPDKERRDIRVRHTRESLAVAKALGCRNISIPPGGPLEQMDWSAGAALFREGLEQVIPEAESLGVKLLIEPEPELFIENSGEFKRFIRDFQSPALGLNFDIGHFYCVGEDPGAAFEDLFEWIGHVHLEDIADTRVHNHLIPGLGVIDYPAIFETMHRLGYAGDISLELYPYVDTPEEAGQESLAYLRPVFAASGLHI